MNPQTEVADHFWFCSFIKLAETKEAKEANQCHIENDLEQEMIIHNFSCHLIRANCSFLNVPTLHFQTHVHNTLQQIAN